MFIDSGSMIVPMRSRLLPLSLFIALALLPVPAVLAHTPLDTGGEHDSLETAYVISNPTKSWASYRELHEAGEAEYFMVGLSEGERLRVSVFIPTSEDPGFTPVLIVMGPGLPSLGQAPEALEVPEGYGVQVVGGSRPDKAEYEPFTPSSYFYTADYDVVVQAGGDYYFAVYAPSVGGRYGFALGFREVFSVTEWLLIPFDVVGIHQWEGQPLALILSPLAACLVVGFALLLRGKRLHGGIYSYVGAAAGLLYIGGGLVTLLQMLIALSHAFSVSSFLTGIFVLFPLAFGVSILRLTLRGRPSRKGRMLFAVYGLMGLATWAGFLVGPALAFLMAVIPQSSTG